MHEKQSTVRGVSFESCNHTLVFVVMMTLYRKTIYPDGIAGMFK